MKIALIGNQNSGKTTLFNALTGMNAKIGNWPGVTIEKKVGNIKGTPHTIVDLPGIYSLSPYSIEEEISRKYIFDEKPDVIINVVDSTSLERSLYLTTQLLELDIPVIIALNMIDILEKKGITIDDSKLSNDLGVDVVRVSALKETGIINLIKKIDIAKKNKSVSKYDNNIEEKIKKIKEQLDTNLLHKDFVAIKLIEEDSRFDNYMTAQIKSIVEELGKKYDVYLEEVIATERYNFIDRIKEYTMKKKLVVSTISDKLDKIFLNRILAFPIFAAIMFAIYYISVGIVGSATVDWVGEKIDGIALLVETLLENAGASAWIVSLITDGVIAGVGAVLGFVPQLIILFTCISILETTGYMSRIALLLDKLFRRIGLSGKSLIPFIVGSGCSVPGIMGSRIIENQDERKMTAILTPFIPCSAKLPIISLFAGYFFENNSGFVSASLYFFAIIIIVLSAMILKKFVFKHTSFSYISELPEYKLPSFKYVLKDVWDKVFSFIRRAGSVILLCSIVIWFMLSFSFKFEYDVQIEESILAVIGDKISWFFYPMIGEKSWGASVSAIQGLVAKEQVVSSMAVIAGFAEDVEDGNSIFGNEGSGLFGFFTASAAYAFMVFNLFSAPCIGAIGALRRELGSYKKMLKVVFCQTLFAWLLATIVYQIGSRIEMGVISFVDILIIIIISLIVLKIVVKDDKNKECKACPYFKNCDKE